MKRSSAVLQFIVFSLSIFWVTFVIFGILSVVLMAAFKEPLRAMKSVSGVASRPRTLPLPAKSPTAPVTILLAKDRYARPEREGEVLSDLPRSVMKTPSV